MHTQPSAAPVHDQARREARRTAIEEHYRPICDDLKEEYNIAAVLDRARGLGCEWVNLDAGGEILDGLPTFEW